MRKQLDHAQNKYVKTNLQFLLGSIDKIPFEDQLF